ncbi:MAG TPA: NERD domain-containing protein/DEAD/DEAH box helicase [Polyangiaceae bacterium]|nr:NERD domain-containing protein/DEAD/DEAH box helicase [Polyangiaceae bacterium]
MPLFPTSGPRPTSSEAERAFFRALIAGLPKGWTAWHSLRVRSGPVFEGEGDFVFAIPDRAILIVEIKGGAIECRDGHWLQNGEAMKQAPRDQAHRLRRILEKKLEETFAGARPPILIATAFPQTPFQLPPSHGDLGDAVLGQQDLPWIGQALEALVDRQLGRAAPVKDHGWSSVLHKLWGETWVPRISLGTRIELRDRELLPLDESQLRVLEMLDHSNRLLVTGGPGTGKTLLARSLCERRAPALYLCWTRALAAAIRASGVAEAWPVREYAARLLAQAGVPVAGGAPSDAWSNETWENIALQAAVDALPEERAHRIVVVDEAQDFTESEWELTKALAGKGPLWAFGDDGQSFWTDRKIPGDLFPAQWELKDRYRCPEPLARFADRYRPDASGAAPPSRFPELRVVTVEDGASLLDRVKREVRHALRDGARPGDVAVLSLRGQLKSALSKDGAWGDTKVVHADDPAAGDHVIADTFLRFKGLERPVILVTELSAGERYAVRMHVALTRATLSAIVVGTRAEIEADPNLEALAASS